MAEFGAHYRLIWRDAAGVERAVLRLELFSDVAVSRVRSA